MRGILTTVVLFLGSCCCTAPRTEGFADLKFEGSRQPMTHGEGDSVSASWSPTNLMMVESGPTLATFENLRVILQPDPSGNGSKVTLTGTLRPKGYCTSPTWQGGIGQVIQIFFEKPDNSLLAPWTVGALKTGSGGVPLPLSFTSSLPTLSPALAAQAELVIQACLWTKCP